MNIQPSTHCPSWCDPRVHVQHGPEDPEHRTAGLTWKPTAADTEVTVRTVRFDGTGPCGHVGAVMVNLRIEDTGSVYPDGRLIEIETDLDPADAEMLAAALVCEAARVRALRARGVA